MALCCLPSDVCHYGVILLSGIRLSEIVVIMIRLSGIVWNGILLNGILLLLMVVL